MVKAYSTTAVSGGTVAGAGSFDIGIKRTSGTVVGMMLKHDKNDVPSYAVFDRKNLADQFFTGVPSQQYQDPEEELPITIDSWRSGFGLEVYDPADPERYRASNGMDMRFRGMAIAGPIATGIALPLTAQTPPTIANADMELSASWTGGTRSSVQVHGGTYSYAVTISGTYTLYQDLSWDASYQSKTFVFFGFVYSDSANQVARIYLNDGVTTTYSSSHTGNSTWQALSVTKTFAANATAFQIGLLLSGTLSSGYLDDVSLSNIAKPLKGVDFNSVHYIPMGNILYKLNGTGDGFTLVGIFPAAITSLEVMTISGTSYLFIVLGLSNNYWYMTTAEAFTESTATVNDFKYFKVVDAASPTMWGNDGTNTLRSTVNPLNGGTAWSGQTTVDASYNDITGLFSDSGLLYVNKEDMPYYLNSSGAVKNDLAPELATLARSTDNGKSANWWLHNFYMPWGQSLLEEDGGVLTWRSPNDYSTQLADFVGTVFAVAGDDRYLFAIVDNSTKIEVLAGRKEVVGSTTKWVWHPINETTLTGCESCWVSAVYQKRLWISSTASGDSLYYIPLPVAYGDVLADANRAFLTGTTMETPWLHGGFRSETKSFIKETLEMGHTYDANIYFTTKYKLLEDTAWTTVGNYTGSSTSMIQSRYIPVDSGSNNPTSTLYKTQFTAVTNDTTKTPVLLNYTLRAVLYPTKGTIIACKVRCAKEITLRDGGKDLESDATIIATLNEARTATYPITIYDWNGDVQTVKMLSLPAGVPYWTPIMNEKDRTIEREYNLLFQVIPIA